MEFYSFLSLILDPGIQQKTIELLHFGTRNSLRIYKYFSLSKLMIFSISKPFFSKFRNCHDLISFFKYSDNSLTKILLLTSQNAVI